MKKYKADDLITKLQSDIKQLVLAAEHLKKADPVKLSYPPAEGKWSVAQCLEHLNAYNRYYLPQIEKATTVGSEDVNAWFTPGLFGDRFTRMMMPKNVFEIKNKMKAPKGYLPERGLNVEKVFKEFNEHQDKLLFLLEISRKRNMSSIRIPIAITRFIKFKLGDTFRFLIAHEQRHMMQARNGLKTLGVATDKFPVILEAAPR